MDDHFMDEEHGLRLSGMMLADGTSPGDVERISLFYIIAGSDELYKKRRFIYDTKGHRIRSSCLVSPGVDFSSGMGALVRLGFNLYNGYRGENGKGMTPMELFWNLDARNRRIALNALRIRMGL